MVLPLLGTRSPDSFVPCAAGCRFDMVCCGWVRIPLGGNLALPDCRCASGLDNEKLWWWHALGAWGMGMGMGTCAHAGHWPANVHVG
jgi:hypothetical protein